EVFSSASIGIAHSMSGYVRPEDLLRDADAAMYRAKEQGRGRHEVFDQTLHAAAVTRLALETDLHGAIERAELGIVFQPIVSLKDGETAGFEALARWRCPRRGLVSPETFIPVAEDTGLIVPIGEWIIREACTQMLEWAREEPAARDCTLSVNLSSRQLLEPDLPYRLADMLAETGFEPEKLVLEITESVLMTNAETAARTLEGIRSLGIGVDVDDFGTGYSSLTYLRAFPIDRLKIDRQFVAGLASDKGDLEIVRAIISLAQSLDIGVVAEGIETREQLSRLRLLGCEFGQGFLFSKPVERHQAHLRAFEMVG
ncbi:MAG: EAL domain-containing protein (putative c-di-GMP-specific phosphodiesterase class I), partial [Myxococcota bacterium]